LILEEGIISPPATDKGIAGGSNYRLPWVKLLSNFSRLMMS
jgi:hypothetical protein